MAVINRFPAGLLNLLDAKILGKTPDELAAVITPIADVTPHYEASCIQQVRQATATAVGVGGPHAILNVPPGEVWIPVSVAARLTGTVADNVRMMLVAQLQSGVSTALATWNTVPQVVVLGSQIVLNWTPTRRIVCLPGTSFGIEISQAAATHDVQTEAWVVALPN